MSLVSAPGAVESNHRQGGKPHLGPHTLLPRASIAREAQQSGREPPSAPSLPSAMQPGDGPASPCRGRRVS